MISVARDALGAAIPVQPCGHLASTRRCLPLFSARIPTMRICLVSPYDLSHDGGVNTHVRALAPALRDAGHQVRILGPASGAVPRGCDGLPGTVAVRANGSVARVGLLVSANAVTRYLARGAFDLVHVHEPYVPGTARLAVQCATVPVVATFHAYVEHEHVFSRVARWAMAPSLAVLCRLRLPGRSSLPSSTLAAPTRAVARQKERSSAGATMGSAR